VEVFTSEQPRDQEIEIIVRLQAERAACLR
jgi:hypothetical protein